MFAAYTIIRERPHVAVCYRGAPGYGHASKREAESNHAVSSLGAGGFTQLDAASLGARGLVAALVKIGAELQPDRVWAPHPSASHPEHVVVSMAAQAVFGGCLTTYHTYVADGDGAPVKVDGLFLLPTRPRRVPFEPRYVGQKLYALSAYATQHAHPRAHVFFTWGLDEWYGEDL